MDLHRHLGALTLALLLLGGGCHRLADEVYDWEALKLEACEGACDTFDTCDPDRFVGMEPADCFERCMTMLPRLHEDNQCGSRELITLQCLGGLTCEGLAAFTEASHYTDGGPDFTVACVTESDRSTSCSEDKPFDLDEPVPSHP